MTEPKKNLANILANILVCRTDRMGDVLLATPVLRALRQHWPEVRVTFLVRAAWQSILQFGSEVQLMTFDENESSRDLASRLKDEAFDVALVLRDEETVTQAIKQAKIPTRVGPYSSFRSFFCFNHGVLQNRSKCDFHEAEYNLDLLSHIPSAPVMLREVTRAKKDRALPRAWISYSEDAVIDFHREAVMRKLSTRSYCVLHPGSSGSARYIKPETMIEIIRALQAKGFEVVLSGAGQDEAVVRSLAQATGLRENQCWLNQPLPVLAELFRHARHVIAHGTGPLHLAAAVGAPVFAIFPPLYVLSEKRWGPLCDKRTVWVPPDVACPEKYRCRGPGCAVFDCMDRFKVQTLIDRVCAVPT